MSKIAAGFVVLGILLSGMVYAATPVSAGQPVAQVLTPPALDYLTCKAVGSGTICQGSQMFTVTLEDTGITCGSGPTAFNIFDSSTLDYSVIWFYDSDGNLVRLIVHALFRGAWSNPLTGAIAPYTQYNVITGVLAVPGDLASSTETQTGEVIIRAGNGRGAPVLIATGRQVFSPDGELLFSAGRNAFVAAIEGDTTAFDAVCAALG
jgi:hypothetical protein